LIWAIAIDVDGTLEVGSPPGPIKLSWIKILQDHGHQLVLIGNRSLLSYVQLPYCPTHGDGSLKSDELDYWRERLTGIDRWLVVDDNPAQYRRGFRGWDHFMPRNFLEEVLRDL
jgi:hypothetical protein